MKTDNMEEIFDEAGCDIDDCTCNDCSDKETCIYAFDLYNTNGDCLAEK